MISKRQELVQVCQKYFKGSFTLDVLSYYSEGVIQPGSLVIVDTSVVNDPMGFIVTHRNNIPFQFVYIISNNIKISNLPDVCLEEEYFITYPCYENYFFKSLDNYFDTKFQLDEEEQGLFYEDEEIPSSYKNMFVGESNLIKSVRKKIKKASENDQNVLLLGDTGTGKTCAAEIIHNLSRRKYDPFVPVYCERIKEELDLSILFGSVKGSFTDAVKDVDGLVKKSNHGVLFFDEFGCLSTASQSLFITFAENKIYSQLGSNREQKLDVKMIFATNINMAESIAKKTFREDVYYRISQNEIVLPSLNDRKEDIPDLVNEYLKNQQIYVDNDVYSILQSHNWKGNLREFNKVLNKAIDNCREAHITAKDLDFGIIGK